MKRLALNGWLKPSPRMARRAATRASSRRPLDRRLVLELLEYRTLLTGVPAEPNDTFDQANDLGTGDQFHPDLVIEPSGDVDVYKWTATQSGVLEVDIQFTHLSGDLDLELYNASRQRVAFSDSLDDDEHITRQIVAGEVYFIRVFGFGGRTNQYDLIIDSPDVSIPLDQFEPNDTFAQAFNLGSGDQVRSNLTIHAANNNDWFKWTAPASGTLAVAVNFSHASGNVDAELYSAAQTLITSSTSTDDNEQLSATVVAGQMYFLRVFTAGLATQTNYSLVINGPDPVIPGIQIIDDGDSGYTTQGTWTDGEGGFGNDVNFSANDTVEDVATWTFNVTPGNYRVSATWLAHPLPRAPVTYRVLEGQTVLGTAAIDQQQVPNDFTDQGASWEDLGGPYQVNGNTLAVRLSDDAGVFVIADAVRVERLGGAVNVPEIQVLVGTTNIADGGTVDFGTTSPSVPVDKVLTVRNTGNADLQLTAINPINLPNGYALVSNLGATLLAPNASTTFTLRLQSAVTGAFGGPISFANSDADENPFDLVLTGSVVLAPAAPEIEVRDGSTNISDGGTVSFGQTSPGVPTDKVLTVRNVGTANLTLSNPPTLPTGYTLQSPLGSTNLAPGASTTLTLRLQSSVAGAFNGPISLTNNDANENPFDLFLTGSVVQAPAVAVIDNGDSGFTTTGNWQVAGNQGFQSDVHFVAAGIGSDIARWTFTVTPGRYRVSGTWFPFSNRATNAPYAIRDGSTVLATVRINQQQAPNDFTDRGASWEDLGGPYNITSDRLVVELSNQANGFVIADALRIEPVTPIPATPEIEVRDGTTLISDGGTVDFGQTVRNVPKDKVLTVRNIGGANLTLNNPAILPSGYTLISPLGSTNLAPGGSTTFTIRLQSSDKGVFSGPVSFTNSDADENPFDLTLTGSVADVPTVNVVIIDDGESGLTTTGNWQVATDQGFRGDVRYSAAGNGSDVARWTFTVAPGHYRVSSTWTPTANRATNSPFTIRDAVSALATVRINQEQAPNDLTDQGASWEDLGGPYNITSSTLVVELTDQANEFVIADAVRIERVTVTPTGPEIEVRDGTTNITDGGTVDFGSTQPNVAVTKTLTVRNLGDANLSLSPINVNFLPLGYQVVSNITTSSLAPGASTTFSIRLQSATQGIFAGAISFGNSDNDETPFDLFLTGAVTTTQIIDNGDAGFSTVGNWSVATGQGFSGDIQSNAAGSGSDVAQWSFTTAPGRYRVSATWTAASTRATNAPFTVRDATTPLATVRINQTLAPNDFSDSGVPWENLGTSFDITSGTLVVQLSDDANATVIADAIRIERVGDLPPGPEIDVLDGETPIISGSTIDFGLTAPGVANDKALKVRNIGTSTLTLSSLSSFPAGFQLVSDFGSRTLAPGASTSFTVRLQSATAGTFGGPITFGNNDANENPYKLTLAGTVGDVQIIDNDASGFSTTGDWLLATDQGFQGDVRYSAAGTGSDVSTWTFTVTPGRYQVSATWTSVSNRATDAPYSIRDGSTDLASVRVNQELAPNDFQDQGVSWENLGAPVNVSGNKLVVRLADNANEFVIADAVRIARVSLPAVGPEIAVLDGTTNIVDGGELDMGTTPPNVPLDKLLTVKNVGTSTLTLSPLNSRDFPAGFFLMANFGSLSLKAGESTTFSIRLHSLTQGTFGGPIAIANSDPDENPFNLTLKGRVGEVKLLDDGDSGFSTAGSWPVTTGQGFQNDVRTNAAGTGNDVATWTFNVTPGRYLVATTWTPSSTRATDSPYTIRAGAMALATIDVNQRLAPNDFNDRGVPWENLGGTFNITGNQLAVDLRDSANGTVVADAVRIERIGDVIVGPEIEVFDGAVNIANGGIVDFGTTGINVPVDKVFTVRNVGTQNLTLSNPTNMPSGFTLRSPLGSTNLAPGAATTFTVRLQSATVGIFSGSVTFGNNDADENPFKLNVKGTVSVSIIDNGDSGYNRVGNWSTFTDQGFGGDVDSSAAGTGADVATWTFVVTPGQYRVSATWTAFGNRATDAPYTIRNGTTDLATVRVNQEQSPNDFSDQGVAWENLGGPYDITSGTLVVRLSDAANEFVIADAIRVERLGGPTNGNGDLLEPNDSFDQATVLGLGDQRRDNLTIHQPGDQDFFRWKATATGTLRVDILFSHAIGDLDLELFDVNRNRLAFSDSINDDESITRQVFADETFFIRVFGFNGDTNTYNLVIDGP